MKKRAIMILPHLNDCKGDLSKQWYVEYQWLVAGEENRCANISITCRNIELGKKII